MIRILIVDDHEGIRKAVREVLTRRLEAAEIEEAGDADEACRRVENEPWQLVLLDLSLGGPRGLDTLRRIKQLCPTLPVLIMSMHPEEKYAPAARAAGAAGYVMKGASAGAIADAVRAALDQQAPGG